MRCNRNVSENTQTQSQAQPLALLFKKMENFQCHLQIKIEKQKITKNSEIDVIKRMRPSSVLILASNWASGSNSLVNQMSKREINGKFGRRKLSFDTYSGQFNCFKSVRKSKIN